MLRTRFNYWTCSKFANWVRGEDKPLGLTMEGWEDWRKEQENKRPIRYYLSDTLLGNLQDFVNYPSDLYDSIKTYLNNRFVDKTHYLKTGLEPGHYHEVDEKILYGLFTELSEFVEDELSWMNYLSKDKKERGKYKRSAEGGIEHLKWAMGLKKDEENGYQKEYTEGYGEPTPQAESSKEILEIYNWWKNVRPYREHPHDISKWSEICEGRIKDKEIIRESLDKLTSIEEQYDKEDEDMMIRLIKIRKSLWT
jgi:hypothetical protein